MCRPPTSGAAGFYLHFWHALWAPEGTPKEIVAKLNGALRTALANPSTRKKLIDLAQAIFPPEEQSPEALRKFQQAEIDKWWPIIKECRHQGAIIRRLQWPTSYGLASPASGRQTSRRLSTSVTMVSITITKAASTNMPANTPATSKTPSACWIR